MYHLDGAEGNPIERCVEEVAVSWLTTHRGWVTQCTCAALASCWYYTHHYALMMVCCLIKGPEAQQAFVW
jgi:hypothetical protein